jgi:pimeloyl-ACP methyl ester carboxylesterase
MSLLTAFRLGFLPNLAGIRFNGDELLTRLQPATDELRPALVALSEELTKRGPETIAAVLECERLIVEAGRTPPGRPRTPAEYRDWAAAVARTGHELFGRSIGEGAALVLGLHYGDLVLTLSLEGFVAALQNAAPEHAFLEAQAAALAEGQKQARDGLALISRSVGLPEAAQEVLEGASTLGATELLARREALEAALTRS